MSPKLIKKLADKKYRLETGLFLVEGEKSIRELLASDFVIEEVIGTSIFLDDIEKDAVAYEKRNGYPTTLLTCVTEEVLERTGTLESNKSGIAVVQQKSSVPADMTTRASKDGIILALDDVRDPGNMGTIIRIADWFGVSHIVASPTSTDAYNPKTISASMGSFTRVAVLYAELLPFLTQQKASGVPILGAVLDGINIHEGGLPTHGILLLGSESHGISPVLLPFISNKLTIPKFGAAESLNVSVATGILLDAVRRN